MSERLDEIRARLEAATGGEWQRIGWDVTGDCKYLFSVLSDPQKRGREDVQQATRNLNFIAHAPNDLRYLLERLRGAERLASALRDTVKAADIVLHLSPRDYARPNLEGDLADKLDAARAALAGWDTEEVK